MEKAVKTQTLEDRIEEKRQEQARELERFTKEERLREELGHALDVSPDRAFVHCRPLYGVAASLHFRDKVSFSDAIDRIEKLETILSPVEMVQASGSFLSHFTAEYWNALPDEKVMKDYSQWIRLLPVKLELDTFGNSLRYFGKLPDGRVIEVKQDVHSFRPHVWVDCIYTKRTLTNTHLKTSYEAYCIHDEDGQTLGHPVSNRMWTSKDPSQHFYAQWENIGEAEDVKRFRIGHLRQWITEQN
jgi:hypothetical protein